MQKNPRSVIFLVVSMALLAAFAFNGLVIWPTRTSRTRNARVAAEIEMTNIQIAIEQYRSNNGCYPPRVLYDCKGQPMHSWRILVLPYLESEEATFIYNEYDFSVPWDSPANLECVSSIRTNPFQFEPNLQISAVTGPDSVWTREVVREGSVTDGKMNTISLACCAKTSRQPFSAPVDVDISEIESVVSHQRSSEVESVVALSFVSGETFPSEFLDCGMNIQAIVTKSRGDHSEMVRFHKFVLSHQDAGKGLKNASTRGLRHINEAVGGITNGR